MLAHWKWRHTLTNYNCTRSRRIPSDAVQRIIPVDPSRKDSPVLNQFAKPIPFAQYFDNTATALEDIN